MLNLVTRMMQSANTGSIELQFDPMQFVNSLKYMGFGMLGIFVVIGLIVVSTVVLNRATAGKKNTESK